jgi:hypothetical protein
MKKTIWVLVFLLSGYGSDIANADFIVNFSHTDFGLTNTFNEVSEFSFEIDVAGDLVAGGVYNNPTINRVDYRIIGRFPSSTPSGFPGFALNRSMDGDEFYGLSLESGLNFSVSATADLTDGLQVTELIGTAPVFTFNAREFNQAPGRYHPPVFTLNSDGTGLLLNANNQSDIPNPPPPIGSGNLVDVEFGEEYSIDLTFDPTLTVSSAIPEPSSGLLFGSVFAALALHRRRI